MDEIDEIAWVPTSEVPDRLTFDVGVEQLEQPCLIEAQVANPLPRIRDRLALKGGRFAAAAATSSHQA